MKYTGKASKPSPLEEAHVHYVPARCDLPCCGFCKPFESAPVGSPAVGKAEILNGDVNEYPFEVLK